MASPKILGNSKRFSKDFNNCFYKFENICLYNFLKKLGSLSRMFHLVLSRTDSDLEFSDYV